MNFRTLLLGRRSIAALSPCPSRSFAENMALQRLRPRIRGEHGIARIQRAGFKLKYSGSQAGSAIDDYYSARIHLLSAGS